MAVQKSLETYWRYLVPFVHMVKFQPLAQFLVDRLAHSVMFSLILFLCLLTAFAYYLIISSLSPDNRYLQFCCLVYFCSDIILMALFCVAIRRFLVSLLRFPFLSHIQVFSYEISLVCRLKYPYSHFSSHFYFLVIFVLLMLVISILLLVVVISLPLHFNVLF